MKVKKAGAPYASFVGLGIGTMAIDDSCVATQETFKS
jgi:hypothetical protein